MPQVTFLLRTVIFFVCFSLFASSSAQTNSRDSGYRDDDDDSQERISYTDDFSPVGSVEQDVQEMNNSLETDGLGHGSMAPTAIIRERNKQARLAQIKNQILQKLGMPTKPNFTANSNIPEGELRRIMARYHETGAEDEAITRPADSDMYAERFNVYTATCDHNRLADREMWDASDSLKYFFDVRYSPEFEKHVTKANLRLYKYSAPVCHCTGPKRTKIDQGDEDRIRVLVYKYLRPLRTNRRVKRKLILTREFDRMYEGEITLNIRNAVQDWLKPQNRNHGIQIVVEDMKGDEQNVFTYFDPHNCTGLYRQEGVNDSYSSLLTEKDLNSTQPILEVSSIEVPKDFASRIRDKRGSRSRRPCRREPLYVSFENLGWSYWIIQPQGFETGYCTGSCAHIGWKFDVYKDAWMQAYECCAPSVLKPLKVVHFDQHGKMTFSMFDNFIIADCGCTSG